MRDNRPGRVAMKKSYKSIDHKKIEIYRDVSETDWNDWKWQLGNTVRDIPEKNNHCIC